MDLSDCIDNATDPDGPYVDNDRLAQRLGIARSMAAEIEYANDESWTPETPEKRWTRMRAWVEAQIKPADT